MLNRTLKTFACSICIIVCSWASLTLGQIGPQATISWRANTETDLAGYRVYQSTGSGQYSQGPMYPIQLGTTSVTVSLPQARCTVRYYWVVTAFDRGGHESAASLEVTKLILGTRWWSGACKR